MLLRSITKNILSIFLVAVVLSNNYDRHLAVTNTLMLDGLASLQKLVLQVCKRWESVLHQLRDKLFKEDMVCDVV